MTTNGPARPDFLVVGAAKSGTTSLWYYLGQHPDCYLAPVKEPHRWASDLALGQDPFLARHPELFLPPDPIDFWSRHRDLIDGDLGRTAASYERLFAGVRHESAAGEASPSYLLSRTAASEIAAALPHARIVILLRHPVDVMHSLHAMLRLGANEPHTDFADALAASRDRRLADPPGNAVWTRYLDVARFAPQVRRYLEAFPREQVHVSLLDDLRTDLVGWLAGIQRFLGLSPRPPDDPRPANDSKVARSATVQRSVVASRGRIGRLASALPEDVRVALARANLRPVARDPLDPGLRSRLVAELRDDITELGDLIDRDLSSWVT